MCVQVKTSDTIPLSLSAVGIFERKGMSGHGAKSIQPKTEVFTSTILGW